MRAFVLTSLLAGGLLLSAGPARAGDRPAAGSVGAPDPRDAEIARLRASLERVLSQRSTDGRARGGAGERRGAEVQEERELSPDQVWAQLLEGNKRFVVGRPKTREVVGTRKRLVAGQHPRAIVLTCSDSRVGPELLFDQNLGEIFVVRTAGNVADAVALGSIEYAVEHLHARLVVVLGHESCGAVAAAASGEDPASPNLRAIVEKIRPAIAKLDVCGTGPLAQRLKIEANIGQSARDLVNQSTLLHDALVRGEIAIVQAVYELNEGRVVPLDQPLWDPNQKVPVNPNETRHPPHY